jgi:hypothetical protein
MKNTCIYLFYYFYLIQILGLYKHSVCRSTGVLPATGADGHAAYKMA